MRTTRRGRLAAGFASVALIGAAATACSSNNSSSTGTNNGTPVHGGTARVALFQGGQPTAIWPFVTPVQNNAQNLGFMAEMFRPLYFYGENDSTAINYNDSPASAPVWSADSKTVTINFKGWKWSNGETVDAQDAMFYLNIYKANKSNYADYTTPVTSIGADYIPDNIVSATASGNTLTLTLDKAYNHDWYTDDELTQIQPMPQAWDLTAAGTAGKCFSDAFGSAAATTDCAADYKYLAAQSTAWQSWPTSPIWSIVDGPWKLKAFNETAGSFSVVPNKSYSGPQKPYLDEIDYVPYTSDTAAYTAEKAGSKAKNAVQWGYIPTQDLGQYDGNIQDGNPLAKDGYYVGNAQYIDEISYYYLNQANATVGPLFKQSYFIKALQDTVDQQGILKGVAKGWGYPTNGLVPTQPTGNALSPTATSYKTTFDTTAAKTLLSQNGWDTTTTPATCTKPGTAAGECGAGIKQGQQAAFTLNYGTGVQSTVTMVAALSSDAAKAGIKITTNGMTYTNLNNYMVSCANAPAGCQWQANLYGSWIYSPYASGDGLLATKTGNNIMSYSDPQMDKLIYQSTTVPGNSAMYSYEDYAISNPVPLVFLPNFSNTFAPVAVANNFHIDNGNAFAYYEWEYWYYTK